MNESSSGNTRESKRSLGLPMITFYGLGTIVSGGFYALTGKVAGEAGMLAPFAFLAASGIALFSAFSFAELSARYPVSAGEAHYVNEAFGRKRLSNAVTLSQTATKYRSSSNVERQQVVIPLEMKHLSLQSFSSSPQDLSLR